MTRHELNLKVKGTIKANVAHARHLKRLRSEPKQPRWGAVPACELEALKGLATLMCSYRARRRHRRHVVVLPRTITLPPREGKPAAFNIHLRDQGELDAWTDSEVAARFGTVEEKAPAKAA